MAIVIIIAVLVLLWLAVGLYAANIALHRRRPPLPLYEQHKDFYAWVDGVRPAVTAGIERIRTEPHVRRTITSADGLTLAADLYARENARGIVLAFHGYGSCGENDFCCAAGIYLDAGWSLLLVQQRTCGDSGGQRITLGVREREDVLAWSRSMAEEFPTLPQVLAGVSMGATSVLTATELPLPQNVRAVIADCSFESPRSVLIEQARQRYGILARPIVAAAGIWSHPLAHIGLDDVSTVRAMRKCSLPVLFIHGETDTFVPIHHTMAAYNAKADKKRLVTVPGAPHTAAVPMGGDRVRGEIVSLLHAAENNEDK